MFNRATAFGYTGGLLSSVTDFAGRVATVRHDEQADRLRESQSSLSTPRGNSRLEAYITSMSSVVPKGLYGS